jgi:hypothetical protein
MPTKWQLEKRNSVKLWTTTREKGFSKRTQTVQVDRKLHGANRKTPQPQH